MLLHKVVRYKVGLRTAVDEDAGLMPTALAMDDDELTTHGMPLCSLVALLVSSLVTVVVVMRLRVGVAVMRLAKLHSRLFCYILKHPPP